MRKMMEKSIADFNKKNIEFERKFQSNCELVARFDDVLTQKASKLTVDDNYNTLLRRFDKKCKDLNDFILST